MGKIKICKNINCEYVNRNEILGEECPVCGRKYDSDFKSARFLVADLFQSLADQARGAA